MSVGESSMHTCWLRTLVEVARSGVRGVHGAAVLGWPAFPPAPASCAGVSRWLLAVLLPTEQGQSYLPKAGKGLSGLVLALNWAFLLYFVLAFSLRVRCLL